MPLTRRTHVLLDERRDALLRQRSAETGRSVGALIRDAIDRAYASEEEERAARRREREAAVEALLAAEPSPVGEWPEIEREIETMYLDRGRDG